jgi:hypothetical protein
MRHLGFLLSYLALAAVTGTPDAIGARSSMAAALLGQLA